MSSVYSKFSNICLIAALVIFPEFARAQSLEALLWEGSSALEKEKVIELCRSIRAVYSRNKWGLLPIECEKESWDIIGYSVQGRPLLSLSIGDKSLAVKNLVQCGIHGDELPSVPMCLNLIAEIRSGSRKPRPKNRVVVQPLLNPDGFVKEDPTRQNANGVDVNRNFPTKDWLKEAVKSWKQRDHEDPRKNPGVKSASEPETRAIVSFLERDPPQKIISVHTPLGFLDLDSHGGPDKTRRAKFLAINMSKNTGNYKFITFGFYPGSLGNYAGRERQIPVYTLELPKGVTKATVDEYWKRFRVGIWRALDFDLATGEFVED